MIRRALSRHKLQQNQGDGDRNPSERPVEDFIRCAVVQVPVGRPVDTKRQRYQKRGCDQYQDGRGSQNQSHDNILGRSIGKLYAALAGL